MPRTRETTPEDEEAMDYLYAAIQFSHSQANLADAIGVTMTTISRWLRTGRIPQKNLVGSLRKFVKEQRLIAEAPRSKLDSVHLQLTWQTSAR